METPGREVPPASFTVPVMVRSCAWATAASAMIIIRVKSFFMAGLLSVLDVRVSRAFARLVLVYTTKGVDCSAIVPNPKYTSFF
jgi:hypothetical protein